MLEKFFRGRKPLPKPKIDRRLPASLAGQGKRGTGSTYGISAVEVEDFIYKGKVLSVASSNWESCQYLIGEQMLIVKYQCDECYYGYRGVSEQEAISLANAPSKGVWGWDNLRVRGSKTAHKKAYIPLAGFRAVAS